MVAYYFFQQNSYDGISVHGALEHASEKAPTPQEACFYTI